MADETKSPFSSWREYYDYNVSQAPRLENMANQVISRLRETNPGLFDNVQFSMASQPKDFASFANKARAEYYGDVTQSKDIIRGRILLDNPEQVEAVRTLIANEGRVLGMEGPKDNFLTPTGTHNRNFNLPMRIDQWAVGEIQVNQKDFYRYSDVTHSAYKLATMIGSQIEAGDLPPHFSAHVSGYMNFARDMHDAGASRVPGIDALLGEKGQARLQGHWNERLMQDPSFRPGFTIAEYGGLSVPDNLRAPDLHITSAPASSLTAELREVEGLVNAGKKGGTVMKLLTGTAIAGYAYFSTDNAAQASQVFYETAVPYGESQIQLLHGDMDAAKRSATIETGGNLGGGAGLATATGTAALVCAPLTPLASAVCAGGTLLVGTVGGSIAGSQATEYAYDHGQKMLDMTGDALLYTKDLTLSSMNSVYNSGVRAGQSLAETVNGMVGWISHGSKESSPVSGDAKSASPYETPDAIRSYAQQFLYPDISTQSDVMADPQLQARAAMETQALMERLKQAPNPAIFRLPEPELK